MKNYVVEKNALFLCILNNIITHLIKREKKKGKKRCFGKSD